MVLKELDFKNFLVVLKELILTVSTLGRVWQVLKELGFNSFYFGRVWWS